MTKRAIGMLMSAAIVGGANIAAAATIFDNYPADDVYLRVGSDTYLSNYNVDGGGQLSDVTFTVVFIDPFQSGTVQSAEATFSIYLDDGDMNVDENGDFIPDADELLYSTTTNTSVLSHNQTETITINTLADNVIIPNNANLWMGVSYDNGSVTGGGFNFATDRATVGTASVGSATSNFFNPFSGISTTEDQAFAFRLNVVPAPGSIAVAAMAGGLAIRRRR